MSGQSHDALEILLDGHHFELTGPLRPTNLNTFPGKVTFGDYSVDANDLLSAWIINDSTGGHGVADRVEANDSTRYRYGSIYTRYPKQYCKPFAITASIDHGAVAVYPLGDMYYPALTAWNQYTAYATAVYRDTTLLGTALTAAPVNTGVAFQGTGAEIRFFIPMGASGYAEYVRSTNTLTNHAADATHPAAVAFVVWDDKLIAIDTAGQLWYALSAAGAFTSYGSTAKLDTSFAPKHLLSYFNRNEDPTVFVVSDGGVWSFDSAGPKLWRTTLEIPTHPYSALGACVWRGDIYISSGMDVIQWNGSVQRNIGLSRDDGLPYTYQGRIVSLCPTVNGLYALVRSKQGASSSSVHEWSGLGWHAIGDNPTTTGNPTWMVGSRATTFSVNDNYAIIWGDTAGAKFYQERQSALTNPRELVTNASGTFGYQYGTGYVGGGDGYTYNFLTGRFNASMQGYRKIANAVECDVRVNPADAYGCTISLYYYLDHSTTPVLLASGLEAGDNVCFFGTADAYGIRPGISFEEIELELVFQDDGGSPSGANLSTPIVENMVLSFLKLQRSSYSWVCEVGLNHPSSGSSPETNLGILQGLVDEDRFFSMVHRGVTYRVRIAQMSGVENLANDTRGSVRLNILEIPETLGPTTGDELLP